MKSFLSVLNLMMVFSFIDCPLAAGAGTQEREAALGQAIPVSALPSAPEVRAGTFLGIFTPTQISISIEDQPGSIESIIKQSHQLKGMTIRVAWDEIEPEDGRYKWEEMDRMIATVRSHGLMMSLEMLAGWRTPKWVYRAGAQIFETNPKSSGSEPSELRGFWGRMDQCPVPWDEMYKRYWRRFVSKAAERYGSEPFVCVNIHGFNHVLEMHMPRSFQMPPSAEDFERFQRLGGTAARAEKEWAEWIDFYAEQFPKQRLCLVMSPILQQAKDPSTDDLMTRIASYALGKHPGRIVLMTHTLSGKKDQKDAMAVKVCVAHPEVPNIQESVGTFGKKGGHPMGSVEMYIYNMRQLSPVFIRVAHLDLENKELMDRIATEYERACKMTLTDYQKDLEKRGLYNNQGSDDNLDKFTKKK